MKKRNIIVVIFLLLFIIAIGLAYFFGYQNWHQQQSKALTLDIIKIESVLDKVSGWADRQITFDNRQPAGYFFNLPNCQNNCVYEIGYVTAQGEKIVVERGNLSNINVVTVNSLVGLYYEFSVEPRIGNDLIEISPRTGGAVRLFSLSSNRRLRPITDGLLPGRPEIYLAELLANERLTLTLSSSTLPGRSISIYFKKTAGQESLSASLKSLVGTASPEAQTTDFDSSLIRVCYNIADQFGYQLELEVIGGRAISNISVQTYSQLNCQGDYWTPSLISKNISSR